MKKPFEAISIDPTDDNEEEEQFSFGSHNMFTEHYPPERVLIHFPWERWFADLGFEPPYHTLIYRDDKAEALYEATLSQMEQVLIDPNTQIIVGLSYQEEEKLTAHLHIEYKQRIVNPLQLNKELESHDNRELPYMALAIARAVAQEIHAPEEPTPLPSLQQFSLEKNNEAPSTSLLEEVHFKAHYTLRLP